MPIHPPPEDPLAVERIEPTFDELPDELDVQPSDESSWITVSYRHETIARYLPVRGIAELHVHLIVDESPGGESEPDEVTECVIKTLSAVKEYGFEIWNEHTHCIDDEHHRQTLVLCGSPISGDEVTALAQTVFDASRYAIDKTVAQKVAQIGSD